MMVAAMIDQLPSLRKGLMARTGQELGIELACCGCSHDSGLVGKTDKVDVSQMSLTATIRNSPWLESSQRIP